MNKMKMFHYILMMAFLVIAMAAFNCSCKSVSKSHHSEATETTQVSVKDSAVEKESTSKSQATARLFKSLTTDSSKLKTTKTEVVITAPVFDDKGTLKSAATITYVGVIEEKANQLSGLSTESSAHTSSDSEERFRAFVHGKDSTSAKSVTIESKKKVADYRWLWLVLIVGAAGLCWWKRGWIIEKLVNLFA